MKVLVISVCLLLIPSSFAAQDTTEKSYKPNEPDPCDVIVSLGDKELTYEQIMWIKSDAQDYEIPNIARTWLETQLVYEEASKEGIEKEARIKFLTDYIKKQSIGFEYIQRAKLKATPDDNDVLKYYEKNKATDPICRDPLKLSFSHIRTKSLEEAREALAKIKNGEDINELAKNVSKYPDAKYGGKVVRMDGGTVIGRFGKDFFDSLSEASEGDMIGPIEVRGGYWEIARHEGKREETTLPFEEVRDQLKQKLTMISYEKTQKELLKSVKDKASDRIGESKWFTKENKEE